MKEYRYKGFSFYQTNTICANNGRCLYVILDEKGDIAKAAGKRPFCTTIADCKEWITKKANCEFIPF